VFSEVKSNALYFKILFKIDFYEVEYDDGFQKAIHQSKIRDQDATNKVRS
jgi:hypothetical protein